MTAILRPSESAHSADSSRRDTRPVVWNAARCLARLSPERANPDQAEVLGLGRGRFAPDGKAICEGDRNRLLVLADLRWKAAHKMDNNFPPGF